MTKKSYCLIYNILVSVLRDPEEREEHKEKVREAIRELDLIKLDDDSDK